MVRVSLAFWALLLAFALIAGPGLAQNAGPASAVAVAQGVGIGHEQNIGLANDLAKSGSAPARPAPDYSLVGMVSAAHWVVKSVMAILTAALVGTLTVLVFKLVQLPLVGWRLRQSMARLRGHESLAAAAQDLAAARDPAALMVKAAAQEFSRSASMVLIAGPAGVTERVRSGLAEVESAALRRLRSGSGLLATVAAVAPFIGLFGTVWGIMFAFISIAESQTTNLAVVAPGIAEALLATAAGLVAAIPAVVLYNYLSRRVSAHRHGLAEVQALICRQLSRELDAMCVTAAKG